MKSLKEFSLENDALTENQMCKVCGGTEYKTNYRCIDGTCSGTDVWYSEDGTTLGQDVHILS